MDVELRIKNIEHDIEEIYKALADMASTQKIIWENSVDLQKISVDLVERVEKLEAG